MTLGPARVITVGVRCKMAYGLSRYACYHSRRDDTLPHRGGTPRRDNMGRGRGDSPGRDNTISSHVNTPGVMTQAGPVVTRRAVMARPGL